MERLRGWNITILIGLTLIAMVVAILSFGSVSEEAIRLSIRATARTSVVLFLLAFGASSMWRTYPGKWAPWLMENRRYIGVSFATSHLLHLAMLIMLGVFYPHPFLDEVGLVSIIGGGLAYVFILLMTITSFDNTAAWLGSRRWFLLHSVGGYYIWLIFCQDYIPRAFSHPLYLPFAMALVFILALRFNVRLRNRHA